MTVKTVKNIEPETKLQLFNNIILNTQVNYMDTITLNYSMEYRNSDRNGNSFYNYKIYGYDASSCRIIDLTYNVACILSLKYDYNKILIIGDDNEPRHIGQLLNKFNEDNNLNFKQIALKEII